MSTPTAKINELATRSLNSSDYIVKGEGSVMYKATLQSLVDFIGVVGTVAFNGALAIADTPSEDGFYFASESGTYNNAGGLVVVNDRLNIISVEQGATVFKKIEIDVSNVDVSTVENFIPSGGMQNTADWSVANYTMTQLSDGINLTASATVSTKRFNTASNLNKSVTGLEDLYLVIDITNNQSYNVSVDTVIASGANTAFSLLGLSVVPGRQQLVVQLDRGGNTYTGSAKFYFNTAQNADIDFTIHAAMIFDVTTFDFKSSEDLKSFYNNNGYQDSFKTVPYSVSSVNGASVQDLSNQNAELKTYTDTAIQGIGVSDVENFIASGDMQDTNSWNYTNYSFSQLSDGINLTAVATVSTKTFRSKNFIKNSITGSEDLYLIMDITNNNVDDILTTFSLASGANTAFRYDDYPVVQGRQQIVVQLDRGGYSYTGDTYFYFNSTQNAEIDFTVHSIMILDVTAFDFKSAEGLKSFYNNNGYFDSFKTLPFASNTINGASVEDLKALEQKIDAVDSGVVLEAHATGTETQADQDNGIFRGVVGGFNAIQRAIDSVPDDTSIKYEIRCYGTFSATTFAEMNAVDRLGRDYKAFISLTGKKNIKIVGTGNRQTIIQALLPSTGAPVDYKWFQPITMDCVDCELENLQIIGENLRYPVHTDTTGGVNYNENSIMKFTNCHFWHKGNSDDALVQWTSLSSFGIGISKGMEMLFYGCRFTSKGGAGFGGHDGYGEENSRFRLENCVFDASDGYGLNGVAFNLFGNDDSKIKFELIGNQFRARRLMFSKGVNNSISYADFSGHGNSRFIYETTYADNHFPEITDVLIRLFNYGTAISQYDVVGDDGELGVGEIFAIALEAAPNQTQYRAIKNTIFKIADLKIKSGEVLNYGDYVSMDNGELVYSSAKTTAKVVSFNGQQYLEIE